MTASSISTETSRETPGSFIVTPVSWLTISHGRLVMRNTQELDGLRHFLDDIAEAIDVRVIERRIDLIEQTERRRIQLEDRKDQRNGRQRLFTTGEQMNMCCCACRAAAP